MPTAEYNASADTDVFDEDQSDAAFLQAIPTCFAVFGPPSSGKSVVAQLLAHLWKCLLVNPKNVVDEALRRPDAAKELKEMLHAKEGVSESVVLQLVQRKLISKECFHYGYVLDDFPSPEVMSLSVEDQFDFVRQLILKVNFVIMIRFPLEDAVRRRSRQYYHSPTGFLVPASYITEPINYAEPVESRALELDSDEQKLVKQPETKKEPAAEAVVEGSSGNEDDKDDENGDQSDSKEKKGKKVTHTDEKDTDGEEQGEHGDQGTQEDDGDHDEPSSSSSGANRKTTFGHVRRKRPKLEVANDPRDLADKFDFDRELEFFQKFFFPHLPMVKGKIQFPRESLQLRVEDSVEWIQDNYLDYKRSFLPQVENFIADYYPLRVIEIDGNMPLSLIPKLLLSRLECMRVQRPPVPHLMHDFPDFQKLLEDPPENPEDTLKQALSIGAFSPRWKWRRSVWGTFCPVSMHESQTLIGSPQFCTAFLDKLYFFADRPAQDRFLENPRLYLLPPNPRVPVRLIIFGPEKSGKTSVGMALGELYGIRIGTVELQVLDTGNIVTRVNQEQKTAFLTAARATALKTAMGNLRQNTQNALRDAVQALVATANDYRSIQPRADILDEVEGLLSDDMTYYLSEIAFMPSSDTPNTLASAEATDVGASTPTPPLVVLAARELTIVVERLQIDLAQIGISHPDNVAEVDRVMAETSTDGIQFDGARYVALLKEMIEASDSQIAEGDFKKNVWILDNVTANINVVKLVFEFPPLLRPTDVVLLKDVQEKFPTLRKYYTAAQAAVDPDVPVTDDIWETKISSIAQQYTDLASLETELTRPELRLHSVDINEKTTEAVSVEIVTTLKNLFRNSVGEYEEPAEDEEAEEPDEDEDGNVPVHMFDSSEDNSDKLPPVGDTGDYCPVAFMEMKTLWPGDPQHGGVIYKDKIYHFSTADAKDKFSKNPDLYLPTFRPFPIPPLRIFVVGITGSGRTTHANQIAELTDGVVINVRNYILELATPKIQKPPAEPFKLDSPTPYWRLPKLPLPNAADIPVLEKELPAGLLPVKLSFLSPDPTTPLSPNTIEQACIDALSGDSSLSGEVLETFSEQWSKAPPFANLILDGFPTYVEDARTLIEKGMRPDVVVILNTESDTAVERILPLRKGHWLQEKKKRDEKRQNSFFNKHREWAILRKTRKAALVRDRDEARKTRQQEAEQKRNEAKARGEEADVNQEEEEEDEETSDESIEQVLSDELPEPKLEDEYGEEESEPEDEAIDTLDSDLRDRLDRDASNILAIKEMLEESKISVVEVNTKRPLYLASKKLKTRLEQLLRPREHAFERAYPITAAMAFEMLNFHYKRLGKFGTWCPVKIRKGHVFPPTKRSTKELYPVVYRQYIYICASSDNRVEFLTKPEYFVRQPTPRLCLPVRIAVIGPPKSGKTSFADRLGQEVGVSRISIGDAIRYVLNVLTNSELYRILRVYLLSGTELPDNLETLCLEAFLRTADCQARGWILDGYPTTIDKLNCMLQRFLVPTVVFELTASNKVCIYRSIVEQLLNKKQLLPRFNNAQVVATRLAHYRKNANSITQYLDYAMRNLVRIDASTSKWKMWYTAVDAMAVRTLHIQDYVECRESRRAAPLTYLCVTPTQMNSRLSPEYLQYCPITLNVEAYLFDCLERGTFEFIAEYQDKYYLFATKSKLDQFLVDPTRWIPPNAVRVVPTSENRARVVKLDQLENGWGNRLAFGGLCSVTYYNYGWLSAGLKPGSYSWMAEYMGKIYLFVDEEALHNFVGSPEKYSSQVEPTKRPPQAEHPTQPGGQSSAVPFLEGEVGPHLMQALNELLEFRPKYPLLGYKESALTFLATYLKSINVKADKPTKDINRDKLEDYAGVIKFAKHLMVNVCTNTTVSDTIKEEATRLFGVRENIQADWSLLNPF